MPSLVSVASLRDFAPSDMSDASMDLLIQASEAELVRRLGPHTAAVETVLGTGARIITLSRSALSVTSVVESDGVPRTLAASEYLFTPPYTLARAGSWPATSGVWMAGWARQTTVTYVPVDESRQRQLAIINLCKLELAFSGYSSLGISGALSEQPLDYVTQREAIFAALNPRKIGFV